MTLRVGLKCIYTVYNADKVICRRPANRQPDFEEKVKTGDNFNQLVRAIWQLTYKSTCATLPSYYDHC